MIPVRGPHQSEALGGCLVCLCLRTALLYDTIRYDTSCFFNVRSKADVVQRNPPHGTKNYKVQKRGTKN